MRIGLALALVLALTVAASADPVVLLPNQDPAAPLKVWTDAGTDVGVGTAWTVYVVGEGANMLSSFDGRFDGPMYQVHTDTASTPWAEDLLLDDTKVKDTHLNFPAAWAAVARPPDQGSPDAGWDWVSYPRPGGGPDLWRQEGVGAWFAAKEVAPEDNMAIGIKGDYQTSVFELAQIVIPHANQDATVLLTGGMGNAAGGGVGIGIDGTGVEIPEPASLGLLVAGAIGMLLRRRRN